MAEEPDSAEDQSPAEVSEDDLVAEEATQAGVPLKPKSPAEPAAGVAPAESADNIVEALLRGPLLKYVLISILIHVVAIVVLSVPGWVSSKGDAAKAKGASKEAKEGEAKTPEAKKTTADGKAQTRDPLTAQEGGEERVKKMLGHEPAPPPKSPLEAMKQQEDDIFKE